jgi:methionyl-tRNA synthetase
MPYGNKDLHFGHVGGVFVQADVFARFLRDRIGAHNVLFVSGTDCYGSPIVQDHRAQCEAGTFEGSIEDFVRRNHERQRATLEAYHVEPDLFAASALGRAAEIHRELGAWLLRTLHDNGHVHARVTRQFYDAGLDTFLTGRQVLGRCPIQGCRSEKAYADECSLGHQYEPVDLIAPRSALTGEPPEMRDVTNWYLDLPSFAPLLEPWIRDLEESGACRPSVTSAMLEYFRPPTLHVTKDQSEAVDALEGELPDHDRSEVEGNSFRLVFRRLEDLETAKAVLSGRGVRYRSGKTLVPFRLTGNLEWGLPVPTIDGLAGLTFWVWPESLWAPISFCAARLEALGEDPESWRRFWCERESEVFQFIGEDNIFFYGLPQAGLFLGTQGRAPVVDPPDGQLRLTRLIANRHLLFLDKKASSSGAVKPPMARDLLRHYTADQLRIHFFSLALGKRSVSFRPKPLDPKADERSADPVLKEGNLLSNACNRIVRSCFYTAQKHFDGHLPSGDVSGEVRALSEQALLDYEAAMHAHEFQQVVVIVDDYVKAANLRWSKDNPYHDDCDPDVRRQALLDGFHAVRVAALMLHPIAPEGTARIQDHLAVGAKMWDWAHAFDPLAALVEDPAAHRLKEVEPRYDFFEKHPSQVG